MLRFRFSKTGYLRFISHLDMQRTFHRALLRASLPVEYTLGFNPQIKMNFSPALSLGYESTAEYGDIWFTEEVMPEEFIEKMNKTLPAGLKILSARIIEGKGDPLNAVLTYGKYEILFSQKINEDLPKKFKEQEAIYFIKKTKAGMKNTDLKPMVKTMEIEENKIKAVLKIGLKAAQLAESLKEYGCLDREIEVENIIRLALYKEDESGNLIDP